MKDEKGIILPIYDDTDNWIGNILINEKLEFIIVFCWIRGKKRNFKR